MLPAPPAEKPGKGIEECEKIAKELLDNLDFQCKSCLKLLQSMNCKPSKSNRLSVTKSGKNTDEYIVLGAFAHGGVQGITKRTHQYANATRYLNACLENHGTADDCSSICINHGSSIKVHKGAQYYEIFEEPHDQSQHV